MSATLNAQSVSGKIGVGNMVLGDYMIKLEQIEGGHRLTVTRGSEVQTMDLMDGAQGHQDAVRYAAQSLDSEQQAQARENIGAAEDAELARLTDELLDNNSLDIISLMEKASVTRNGVTYDWNGEYFTVNGTATNSAYMDFFSSPGALPFGLKRGGTYYVKYASSDVQFRMFAYVDGVLQEPNVFGLYADGEVVIPENISGCILRLNVAKGKTVENLIVYPPRMLSAPDNADLYAKLNAMEKDAKLLMRDSMKYTGDVDDIASNSYVYVEAGGANLPVENEAFFVRTVLYNEAGTALMQTAYGWTTGNIYHRRKINGAFKAWISVTKKAENVRYIAFGDSLMWGAKWVEADNENGYEIVQAAREYQMPTIIAKEIGAYDNFSNEAVGGMAFVPASGESMLDKIKSVDISGAELITLGGGRNDSDTPLGTAEDSTPGDGTICGAIREILDYITAQNPLCQIVMTQVTPATGDNSIIFTKEYGGGWSLNSYRDEVSRVCAEYGVPFVSWDGCTYIRHWADFTGAGGNYSHPNNDQSYVQMGRYLAGKISAYGDTLDFEMKDDVAELKGDLDNVRYIGATQDGAWDYAGLPVTVNPKQITFVEDADSPFASSPRYVLSGQNFFPDTQKFNKASPLNGITFEQTGRVLHISGTATGSAVFYCMNGDSLNFPLPGDVQGGDSIVIRTLTSGTLCKYVLLQFAFYNADGTKVLAQNHDFSTSNDKSTTITLPDGAAYFRVNYSVKSNVSTEVHDRYIVAAMYKSSRSVSQETSVDGSETHVSLFPMPAAQLDYDADIKTYVDMRMGEGNKLSYENLGYLTPEMFGAVGDNYSDDAAAIQQCLDSGLEKSLPVRMPGRYLTSAPLRIGSGMDVWANSLNYTGTDAAIILDCEKSRVEIRSITSNGIGVRLTGETVVVTANDLTLGTVVCKSHCISLETPVKALYGNRIRFMLLKAGGDGCYCITTMAGTRNAYLTENTFTGGHCTNADWAFYGSVGNGKFYDIQVEDHIKGGFCFVNGSQALIVGDRHAESQRDGEYPYLKLMHTEDGVAGIQQTSITAVTYIANINLGVNEIDVSEVSTILGNGSVVSSYGGFGKIQCPIGRYLNTGSNESKHYQLFGMSALIWANVIIYQEVPYRTYTVTENLDLRTITEDTPAMPSVFDIGCENCEIHLHPTYCFLGIQRFEVVQTEAYQAKIYDYYANSVVFDGSQYGAGVFEVSTCLDGDSATIDGTGMVWRVRRIS